MRQAAQGQDTRNGCGQPEKIGVLKANNIWKGQACLMLTWAKTQSSRSEKSDRGFQRQLH
jgi:hypothetical protein